MAAAKTARIAKYSENRIAPASSIQTKKEPQMRLFFIPTSSNYLVAI
jgi:hypothetical protein